MVKKQMDFSEWLDKTMKEVGISQTALAKITSLSPSAISLYLSGQRLPTAVTCARLARGLGVSVESVMMAADIYEEKVPDGDPFIQETINTMRRMTQEERDDIMQYVKWRYRQNRL